MMFDLEVMMRTWYFQLSGHTYVKCVKNNNKSHITLEDNHRQNGWAKCAWFINVSHLPPSDLAIFTGKLNIFKAHIEMSGRAQAFLLIHVIFRDILSRSSTTEFLILCKLATREYFFYFFFTFLFPNIFYVQKSRKSVIK